MRWYCKYGIDYRELEEMMKERGIDVDHSMIYIKSILGFKTMKTAYATIKGFEVMRVLKKGQARVPPQWRKCIKMSG